MENNGVPMLIYAERDYYGGFVVDIYHNNHPNMIKAVETVMNEKPQPFILREGLWWIRSVSYDNSNTVRVEYDLDTTRTDLHLWSYSVMVFIFRWYCCRAADYFKGGVIGDIAASYTPAYPRDGNPSYHAWCLSAPVKL
jgi:hypothetical protein